LEDYLEKRGDFPLCVSLETAHPAKFPNEISELLGINPELPQSMKDLDGREGDPVFLDADDDVFRTYLREHLKGN
jgi:threonine synthase